MAKTLVNLSKQASGLTLNLGTESTGNASKLTLHSGADTTQSVVLDAKGKANIVGKLTLSGIDFQTAGLQDGQALVFDGNALKPAFISEPVFNIYAFSGETYSSGGISTTSESWTKINTLFYLPYVGDSTNYYYPAKSYNSTYNFNMVNDSNAIDLYNLSYQDLNQWRLDQELFVNLGGYLVRTSHWGIMVTIEDLFQGRHLLGEPDNTVFTDYSGIEAAQRDRDAGWLMVADTSISSVYNNGAWYSYGSNIKWIPLPRVQNPEYDNLKVYGPYDGYYEDGSYFGLTTKLAKDVYVDGILDYSLFPLRQQYMLTNYHNIFDSSLVKNSPTDNTGGGGSGSGSGSGAVVSIPDDGNLYYIQKKNNYNTYVFRDGVIGLSANTLYSPTMDIKGTLNNVGDLILSGTTTISGDTTVQGIFRGNNDIFIEGVSHFRGKTNLRGYFRYNYTSTNNLNPMSKNQIDTSAVTITDLITGLTKNSKFLLSDTLAGRNSIAEADRSLNLNVVLDEGSTNELVVNGVTKLMPRTFILKQNSGGSLMGTGDQSDVWIEQPFYDGTIPSLKSDVDTKISAISGSATTTKTLVITGTKDGVNKVFTYSETIKNNTLLLYVNGILQSPLVGEDYVIDYAGKTITFEYAPEAGDRILGFGAR
jgi:hypothetical protein